MTKRRIIGKVHDGQDQPWPGVQLRFSLMSGSFTDTIQYPKGTIATDTQEDGSISVELWCNSEGLSNTYETTPDNIPVQNWPWYWDVTQNYWRSALLMYQFAWRSDRDAATALGSQRHYLKNLTWWMVENGSKIPNKIYIRDGVTPSADSFFLPISTQGGFAVNDGRITDIN